MEIAPPYQQVRFPIYAEDWIPGLYRTSCMEVWDQSVASGPEDVAFDSGIHPAKILSPPAIIHFQRI